MREDASKSAMVMAAAAGGELEENQIEVTRERNLEGKLKKVRRSNGIAKLGPGFASRQRTTTLLSQQTSNALRTHFNSAIRSYHS